jgi:hypothetical protein
MEKQHALVALLALTGLAAPLAHADHGDPGVQFSFTERGPVVTDPGSYPIDFVGPVYFANAARPIGQREAWISFASPTCDYDVCFHDVITMPFGTLSSDGDAIASPAPAGLQLHGKGAVVALVVSMHGDITDGTGAFVGATGSIDSANGIIELDANLEPVWVDMTCIATWHKGP